MPEYFQTLNFSKEVVQILWDLIKDGDIRNYVFRNYLFEIPEIGKKLFVEDAKKIVPSLKTEDIYYAKGFGGVRPQVLNRTEKKLMLGEASIDTEKGIIFRDVTSILQDAEGLHLAIDLMQEKLKDVEFDVVVGPESRGFIFGVPIAYNLHKPFIPIRKKGKLPCETVSVEYELEYGTATIEMHKDAIKPGQRVVIIDDLIATGGTNEAMVKLIEGLGGKVVKTVFLMELAGLKGRDRLEGYDVDAVITYPGK